MKKLLVCLLLFSAYGSSFAQNRLDSLRNYQWVMGYGNLETGKMNHTLFSFLGDTLTIRTRIEPNSLYMGYTNTSISDTLGKLLFFSNGCGVMDSSFHYISGLEQINEGELQSFFCEELGGGPRYNSMVILPQPNGIYYDMIYFRTSFLEGGLGYRSDKMLWTKVGQDSLGALRTVFRDSTIIDTFFFQSSLSVCRHANGKDWWVVEPGSENNKYYTIKVGGDGVETFSQAIGITGDYEEESTGESVFSPDGTKYARYSISSDVQVFDFDRCTGLFSNPLHVPILDAADTSYSGGIAFSPSGRYLYVSSTRYIYQFDMEASDFGASRTTVAVYDGFQYGAGFSTRFFQCELAPDGKIYVSCPGGRHAIHVIERPDSAGVACQVVQHKYILEKPIAGGLPHFPNFRLGSLSDTCTVVPVGSGPDAGWWWAVVDSLQPLSVGFVDTSGGVPVSWHWDFGDGQSGQDSSPVHTYAQAGTYLVCLVVSNPYSADTLCQLVTVATSGVGDVGGAGAGVWAYPNPANSTLHLVSQQIGAKYTIYNLFGSEMVRGKLNNNVETVQISSFPEGIYLLQVEGEKVPVKFVITHQ